jgi:ribosome maturation factor RimP
MDILQKITDTIEPSLAVMGYTVVQIKLADGLRRKTLTIVAERQDEQAMGFDDCAEISRTVSALLDVEDPIQSAYDLEVSSPGLDRPLTRPVDYTKYAGCEAKCETFIPLDGRKRFRGILKGMEGEHVIMDMPEGEARIAYSNIRSAKLVLTDELVATAMKKDSGSNKKKKHIKT